MTAPADAPPLQLADLWTMVRRRGQVAAAAAVAMAIAVIAVGWAMTPALYRAEATLTMDRGPKPVGFANDATADQMPDQLVNTQRELLASGGVLADALAMGGLLSNPAYAHAADPAALLAKRLHINVVRSSWVISVSLEDEDPVRAEAGLQSVLDAFLAHQATLARTRGADDIAFVEGQLAEATKKLDVARDAERLFRTAHAIASTDPDRNHITARIQTLAEHQAALDERVAASAALLKQVQAVDAIEDRQNRLAAYLRIDTISTFTVVGALQKDLFELQGEEAELSAKYLDKHPKLIEVRSHIAAKRAQLEETIAAARAAIAADNQVLVEQRAELIHAQEGLQRDLNDYRENLVALQRLALESQAQQKLHDELLARRAQLAALAGYDDRRMVVDGRPRSSPVPRSVGSLPLLALAAFAGVAAGVAAAALADALDRSVRDAAQVRQATGLRVLGALPHVHDLQPVRVSGPADPMELAEAVRGLWTALQYSLGQAAGCRVLAIVSPGDGDGRSSLAARLAVGAAMAGSRVLLVDGDLRQPVQAAQFGVVRDDGLARLLAGEPNLAPSPSGLPNLDLMPAGQVPGNPGELLHSHCLGEWLEQCRGHYDALIIDTPPLSECADALILAGHASSVLLLARTGRTTLADLDETLQRLEPVRAKVAGIVLAPRTAAAPAEPPRAG